MTLSSVRLGGLLGRSEREGEREGRALAPGALHADAPAHAADQPLRDRQAQPEAAAQILIALTELDRTAARPLLWPEGSREVFALYPARAAGGGRLYLTDSDRVLLRFSNLGGATYFPSDAPEGVIVDPDGAAGELHAEPASEREVFEAARDLVDDLVNRSRNEVVAEVTARDDVTNGYIIDMMNMVALAADRSSRRELRRLETVRIGIGEAPRARFSRGVLDISINPDLGYAGRPSSAYIAQTLARGG